MKLIGRWLPLLLVFFLAGCKTDLYNGLQEEEANKMLALLMLRQIDAEKKIVKAGEVTIRVDKKQFANAVEVLRQNGLPRRKTDTMADLFPSGQLVTSPAQEHAKIIYLKEQQLEEMLRSMNGVVNAQVSIAEEVSDGRRQTPAPSASVFINYSPEINLANHEADIKGLVSNGIPGLKPENVSIVLQPARYRYQVEKKPLQAQAPSGWQDWLGRHKGWLIAGLGMIIVAGVLELAVLRPRRRSK